jgi:hypothetical protein
MRDVNAGRDIKFFGNNKFVINDNSQHYKQLIQCTNEELLDQETRRRQLLSEERKEKRYRILLASIAVLALCIFVAGVLCWFLGDINSFALFTGAAGFMVSLASLKIYHLPNDFEKRQLSELAEIKMLLQERGVR